MSLKYKGVKIDFGGEEYVCPPLSLGSLEVLQDQLEKFTGGADSESVKTVIDATFAAMKRNYPQITREFIAETVDLGNMQDVMLAVMDISGLRRKEQEGAVVQPGE